MARRPRQEETRPTLGEQLSIRGVSIKKLRMDEEGRLLANLNLPHDWGKHFRRTVSLTQDFNLVLKRGVEYLGERARGQVGEVCELTRCYIWLRESMGPELDQELLGDTPDSKFRLHISTDLQEGGSEGRTDDLKAVNRELPQWEPIRSIPEADLTTGFSNDTYARLMATVDTDLDDPTMRQELREGLSTPPSNQFYAACYKDNKLPAADKQFDGLFEGDLLRRTAVAIFHGPSAANLVAGEAVNSSHKKSKCGKFNMTEMSVECIAYCVVILRCALSGQKWYEVQSASDPNYDYLDLYDEVVAFLKDPALAALAEPVIKSFNQHVFPRTRRQVSRPNRGRRIASKSARELAMAALRQAAHNDNAALQGGFIGK